MLEFYEVNELEQRWEKYNQNRKKSGFLAKFKNLDFKFDKTIIGLLVIISVAIGAILWLLNESKDDSMSMAQINQNIVNSTPEPIAPKVETMQPTLQISKSDFNMSATKVSTPNENRASLNLNEIGVNSSEDGGGFTITNNYENTQNFNQNYNGQNFNQNPFNQNSQNFNQNQNFNAIPRDEIIDFGKSPFPPKSGVVMQNNTPKVGGGKIEIKTSTLNVNKQSIESKFYATNDITYSLMLAEEAYNKKDYDNAIKWALTSNEINKDSIESWIIFAKANYKKGRKNDAIYALESFNAKHKNHEIEALISQIKSGSL